jgi:hypothetical protein
MEALLGAAVDLSNLLIGRYIHKQFGLSEKSSRTVATFLLLTVLVGAAFAAWFAYLTQTG